MKHGLMKINEVKVQSTAFIDEKINLKFFIKKLPVNM